MNLAINWSSAVKLSNWVATRRKAAWRLKVNFDNLTLRSCFSQRFANEMEMISIRWRCRIEWLSNCAYARTINASFYVCSVRWEDEEDRFLSFSPWQIEMCIIHVARTPISLQYVLSTRSNFTDWFLRGEVRSRDGFFFTSSSELTIQRESFDLSRLM